MKNIFIFLVLTSLAACKGGGGSSGGAVETQSITGKLTYDFIPVTNSGLDYENSYQKPLRKIFVEAVNSSNDVVVGSGSTDLSGNYQINIPKTVTQIYLIASAEIKSPSIVIEDNTNGDAVYAAYSTDYTVGADTVIEDLNVPSGWAGTNAAGAYTSSRYSAPFAILDTVLTAATKIAEAKPSLTFPQLKINWSTNNLPASGDVTIGQIGTSHYRPSDGELYILGKMDVDTDEHDAHIIVHEWGHYFEDGLGRSDSFGGDHSTGDKIDIAVAFGEGWGNALSGIVLDPEITYRDTYGARQGNIGVNFSLESSVDSSPGWYSEVSIQEMIFDLYDSTNDAGDTLSAGLAPIVDIMTTYQKDTRAKTSVFSFMKGYKTKYPTSIAQVDSITTNKSITAVQDDFGTGETHNGGEAAYLPIFNGLVVNGATVQVQMWGSGARSNEMANNRYYKLTATTSSTRIMWDSDDTYILEVFDGKTSIFNDSEIAPNGNVLGPFSHVIPTTPGKVYTVRIATDGDFVFSQVTAVVFNMHIQSI